MTPAKVNRLIRIWRDNLGLGNWQVAYCPDPAGEDEHGAIEFDPTHAVAVIRLEAGIPDAAVERVVVHEMLHLLFGDMNATATMAAEQLGSEAKQVMAAQWDRAEHRAITNLLCHLGFDVAEWGSGSSFASAFPL